MLLTVSMPDKEEAGMLMCLYEKNVVVPGIGAQGIGGRGGTQWAVGFKQGTIKDGDSPPWTRDRHSK